MPNDAMAPVITSDVPITTDAVHMPEPSTGRPALPEAQQQPEAQPQQGQDGKPPVDPKGKRSIDDSIKDAFAKSAADKEKTNAPKGKDAAQPEAQAKPAEQPAKAERGQDGRFAPKALAEGQTQAQQPAAQETGTEQQPRPVVRHEAPPRFDAVAKADWEKAPDSVKGATTRAIRELESGLEKYREGAKSWDDLRQFDELAKKHNLTVKSALENYTNLEKLLATDPVRGLNEICQRVFKTSIHQVAAQIAGQQPDQVAGQKDREIAELKQTVSQLTQQVQGIVKTTTEQRRESVTAEVQAFAETRPHFAELEGEMAALINAGIARNLSEAYEKAARMNGLDPGATGQTVSPSHKQPVESAHPRTQPQPLTPAGRKSVSGSISGGATAPTGKKGPAPSIDDALNNALRLAS